LKESKIIKPQETFTLRVKLLTDADTGELEHLRGEIGFLTIWVETPKSDVDILYML
jgi:hypothetical protein